ncbi:PIN domain-containing protein [Kitasatospora sp. NPDC047058]|uniref:PIN domain-containing protein n=1 Tax=Kitasatospora sp. NPDC047058 TaxID=3155620 RepID=UPI0033C4E6FC
MIYLLDTNVVAEITTRPKPAAPDPLRRAGFERALEGIRDTYRDRIAAVGEREALAYLAVHRQLKSSGTSIDPPDALIAATALANGWTLVSRNIKHLARTGALVLNPWEYEA